MQMMTREMIVQMGLREAAREIRIDGREQKVLSSGAIHHSPSNPRLYQCLTVCTQERPLNRASSLPPHNLNHPSHSTLTPHLPALPQMAPPAFLQELAQSQLSSLFPPKMVIYLNSTHCKLPQARSMRLRASATARRSRHGRRW